MRQAAALHERVNGLAREAEVVGSFACADEAVIAPFIHQMGNVRREHVELLSRQRQREIQRMPPQNRLR